MKKLLILMLLSIFITGCAGVDRYFDALETVEVGDSYETMVAKMGYAPPDYRCFVSSGNERACNATYWMHTRPSVFWLVDDRITEISI